MLNQILEIINDARAKIVKLDSELDFDIDVSIQAAGVNHPLAIEARDKKWKPGRHEGTAWYEKGDEYVTVTVYVE